MTNIYSYDVSEAEHSENLALIRPASLVVCRGFANIKSPTRTMYYYLGGRYLATQICTSVQQGRKSDQIRNRESVAKYAHRFNKAENSQFKFLEAKQNLIRYSGTGYRSDNFEKRVCK